MTDVRIDIAETEFVKEARFVIDCLISGNVDQVPARTLERFGRRLDLHLLGKKDFISASHARLLRTTVRDTRLVMAATMLPAAWSVYQRAKYIYAVVTGVVPWEDLPESFTSRLDNVLSLERIRQILAASGTFPTKAAKKMPNIQAWRFGDDWA